MEQRHVVYIAAAAITAGTVAACHLIFHHNSLHLLRLGGIGGKSITQMLHHVSSNVSSTHPGAPLLSKRSEQAVGQCRWDWAQSLEEVLIELQLPHYVTQQEVHVKLQQQHLSVHIGQQRIINGELAGQIQPQNSSWHLEGTGSQRVLSISLCKAPPLSTEERFSIWTSLLLTLTEDDTDASADQLQRH